MARKRLLATLGLLAGLSGCNWYYDTLPSPDDLMKAVPWFDHMIKSPTPSPYQRADIPRYTPKGSVPITGGEADWGLLNFSGPVPMYGFDTLAANRVRNPTVAEFSETLARGEEVYRNYCAVCHGGSGAGDGPVGVRMGAQSLLSDKAKGYTDGYLYSIVRYGRGVMPMYGDKVFRQHDRWAVVNYMRHLQGITPAASAVAAEGASQ